MEMDVDAELGWSVSLKEWQFNFETPGFVPLPSQGPWRGGLGKERGQSWK